MKSGLDFGDQSNNPFNDIAKNIVDLFIWELLFIIALLVIVYVFRFNRTLAQYLGVIGVLGVLVLWLKITLL